MKIIRTLRNSPKNKQLISVVVGALILVMGVGAYAMSSITGSKNSSYTSVRKTEKVYKITNPTKNKDERKVLTGKVISHESAQVFPRRSGIVSDILVDIGDSVRKGQVIAYMLPEGVENVSNLEIARQRNMMEKSLDDFTNTKLLSEAEINKLETTLAQKEIMLERLIADKYEFEDGSDNPEIRLLATQLEEKKVMQTIQERDAQNKVNQSRDGLYIALEQSHLTALLVLGAGEGITIAGFDRSIEPYQVSNLLGANDTQALNTAANAVNLFRAGMNMLITTDSGNSDYIDLSNEADAMLISLQRVLSASGTAGASTIDSLSNGVQSSLNKLFMARDKFENALEAYALTESKNREAVTLLEENIDKQETEVVSRILIMQADISKFEKEIEFAKARTVKNIDSSENTYLISNTQYLKTAAQKGHAAIRSPFNGVISIRSINVGELAMTGKAIFDLTEVQTTLSKKAKNEIQFGLPEDLQDIIQIGDAIEFHIANAQQSVYIAEITRLSPQIDRELHTVTVQAKLSDDLDIPHNTSVQVSIVTGEKNTYLIDSSGLKRSGDEDYVWVQNGENIDKVIVEVIEEDGEFAEVTADITTDTKVVMNYYGK